MTIHAKIKADGSHAVVEIDHTGRPEMDETGAMLIEDDGGTAWFVWEDFELVSEQSGTVKKLDVITTAAMLLGNDRDSVDPEYSRAIAELVNELTGTGSADDVEATETMLWAIAVEDADVPKCPVCGELGYSDPEECSFCQNQK